MAKGNEFYTYVVGDKEYLQKQSKPSLSGYQGDYFDTTEKVLDEVEVDDLEETLVEVWEVKKVGTYKKNVTWKLVADKPKTKTKKKGK